MTAVVDELAQLVGFPTVSSRPILAIAAHLAERAESAGFVVERFDDPSDSGKTNIVASVGPADAPGGLVISGHMDVVPVDNQPWETDPFVLTEVGDKLVGRGSADMKGFIAATVIALERLDLDKLIRPLTLIWTHDEEVGCKGSAILAGRLLQQQRVLPRDCLIGEPTDFQVLRMHAGHVGARVTARGAAAHSAFPELGANAIAAASLAVGALHTLAAELAKERHPAPDLERDFIPLNVGLISGGSAINIVPDKCHVDFGFRPLPGMGHEPLIARISELLAALSLPDGTDLTLQTLRVTPSLNTPANTPLAAALLRHSDVQQMGAAGFATDGGNLSKCGCEPLVFGPGSIRVAHQANEHIHTAALHRAVDIVEQVITDRCTRPVS